VKKSELKSYDGKDGRPAYISYNGKVYDVSKSSHWKEGVHMGRHKAGEDLTDFISMAPHDDEVFARVEQVGSVEGGEKDRAVERKEMLRDLYRKFHPHPIMIHFPIGLFFFGALMQFIFLLTKNASFEYSAFYAIAFGTLCVFPAMASGMFSWWVNYDMTLTSIFKNKLGGSITLLISALFLVTVRLLIPDIASRADALSFVYNALVFINVPVTLFVAYNGGKITWPS
jgi:predicted heme/steroid binding protein/uncharacterized membrane protein